MTMTERRSALTNPVPLASLTDPAMSPELYRQVYVSLALPADADTVVIGVTSAISGEGRTTIALGLALTLADDLDIPVSLVEVDFDRPALAEHFHLPAEYGLCDVLRGERRFEEVAHRVAENLSVITAGAPGPDTARLMRQLPGHDLFHDPQEIDGVIILDLPPIMNHSYSALVAGVADALVMVVRAGVTPIQVAREAIARLEDRPPIGVVFNGPRSSLPTWWAGRGI